MKARATLVTSEGNAVASDLVRFRSEHLEHLRALLVYKNQVAGPRFAELVGGLDNPALEEAFQAVARDAREEQSLLQDIVTAWMSEERPAARRPAEPSTRELVETWIALQEAAAERLREAARAAPTPALRSSLDRLAHRDAVHAEILRGLL